MRVQNADICIHRRLKLTFLERLRTLTCRRDRNAASFVCHSWYRAEALTRSDLFIGNCYAISPHRATSRFRRVRFLTVKGKPCFADFDLLPLNWVAHFSPWGSALADAYPWLEKLHLKRVSLTDDNLNLIARSFPSLKELVLVCREGFGIAGIGAIAASCRLMRVLDLVESVVEDADEDEEVMDWISCFSDRETHLESLVFECVECRVNFEALERLVARSPYLKKLRLNHYVFIPQLYRLMHRAPQLTHLGTGSFCASNDVAVGDQELDYSSAFAACKSLVCLSGFRDILPD
ncbi:F-box protein FBX14-like [Arachis stenosperma]|uniref:F-box protein FBX14-like n=1 Tax=Arachis stenosperma TaxID=217475 RepID=UPI0025AC7445|nr:F-box protein FBX14-like [Arachis stenosperma]